jgi:hypothetical protein
LDLDRLDPYLRVMDSDYRISSTVVCRAAAVSRRQVLRTLVGSVPAVWLGTHAAFSQSAAGGSPASRPFDPDLLARAVRTARDFHRIHALIIARKGEIAFAEAFRGPAVNRAVNVKSVS